MDYKKTLIELASKLGINLEEEEVKLAVVQTTLEDDSIVYSDGAIALESVVYSDEAMEIVLPDGTYTIKEIETIFKVIDGVVGEFTEKETEEDPEKTDEEVEAAKVEAEKLKLEEESSNKELIKNFITTLFAEEIDLEKDGYHSIYIDIFEGVASASFYMNKEKTVELEDLKLSKIEFEKTIADNKVELEDLTKENDELSGKVEAVTELLKQTKLEFNKKPAKETIKFGEDNKDEVIEKTKETIAENRMKLGAMFNQISR